MNLTNITTKEFLINTQIKKIVSILIIIKDVDYIYFYKFISILSI